MRRFLAELVFAYLRHVVSILIPQLALRSSEEEGLEEQCV